MTRPQTRPHRIHPIPPRRRPTPLPNYRTVLIPFVESLEDGRIVRTPLPRSMGPQRSIEKTQKLMNEARALY